MGGAEYAKIGRPNNTGTRILCVSGDVQRPGYYEVEVGSRHDGQLINDMCGGPKHGRKLKAVIPGGTSAKVLRADETLQDQGRREMSRSRISRWISIRSPRPARWPAPAASSCMDDSRDMVWTLNNINEFYAHESCGQCTPCREGSLWMKKITDRMLARRRRRPRIRRLLKNVADNIAGRTICAFGEACSWPTQSFVEKFRDEFAAKRQQAARRRRCRRNTPRTN